MDHQSNLIKAALRAITRKSVIFDQIMSFLEKIGAWCNPEVINGQIFTTPLFSTKDSRAAFTSSNSEPLYIRLIDAGKRCLLSSCFRKAMNYEQAPNQQQCKDNRTTPQIPTSRPSRRSA